MRRLAALLAALALATVGLADASAGAAPSTGREGGASRTLTVVDLGAPAGAISSQGVAINERGWVVGWSDLGNDTSHAILWRDGEIVDLGTLEGPAGSSYANDINERGDIVGYSTTPTGVHAVLWRGRRIVDLGTLGGSGSMATGINDRGDIVGSSNLAGEPDQQPTHAFLWRDGRMTDLGTAAGQGFSAAEAVNARGRVVGASGGPVEWRHGTARPLPALPGGDGGGTAFDVNGRGDVVGYSMFAEGVAINRATLWRRGVAVDLGFGEGSSHAYGMNDRGQIVGWRDIAMTDSAGFLWDDGGVTLLPSLTGAGGGASDINDRGVIVGSSPFPGDPHRGLGHAVIWR